MNVPPTREGLLHETDVARLRSMHERLTSLFADDLAAGREVEWRTTGASSGVGEVDLGRSVPVGIADLREDIARGQYVARYTLEGLAGDGWRTLSRGATIGYRKLDRFAPVRVRRVRVTVEDAVERLGDVGMKVYPGSPAGA